MAKYKIVFNVDIQSLDVDQLRKELADDPFYKYAFLGDLRWSYLESAENELVSVEIEEDE